MKCTLRERREEEETKTSTAHFFGTEHMNEANDSLSSIDNKKRNEILIEIRLFSQ